MKMITYLLISSLNNNMNMKFVKIVVILLMIIGIVVFPSFCTYDTVVKILEFKSYHSTLHLLSLPFFYLPYFFSVPLFKIYLFYRFL